MKKLTQNLWFNVFSILVLTFLGLWLALYDSYETVIETITQVELWRLLLIIGWGVLPTLIWGIILTLMARHVKPDYQYKQGLATAFIGGFMAGMTPSSTGGQVAQTGSFKRQGINASHGAGLIWMDFYLYSIGLVVFTLVLFVVKFRDFESLSITLIFGFGLIINIIIILVLFLMVEFPNLYRKITDWVVHYIATTKFVKNKEKMLQGWNDTMDNFHSALQSINENKAMIGLLLALNALRLAFYFSTPFAIAQLLELKVPWTEFVHLMALASFVTMANTFVPLPGASGATEGLFVLSYSTVIGKASAASTMILWRFSTFYMILFIGGYLYLHHKQSHIIRRHIAKKKENFDEKDLGE